MFSNNYQANGLNIPKYEMQDIPVKNMYAQINIDEPLKITKEN